ncbi:MAG: zinc-ribbon domain-containing protein [Ruminococcaceae bacterium]|nr:zinc-ribbon domain-containing protein [Oscillospiraceae bacterium]
MDNYIGKICPYCKTAITASEPVKVCPSCGIPHHAACWAENHGCTTFGCTEQYFEAPAAPLPVPVPAPAAVTCTNCGVPLGEDQAFCPKCGTPKAAPQKPVCQKCGNELQPDQAFCPKCGQKAGEAPAASPVMGDFTAASPRKRSPKLPIFIGAAVIAVIVIGVIIGSIVGSARAKAAYEEYLDNAEEFMTLALDAGANLEDISDTIVTYWHENIYDDLHGSSIDTAIALALIDKSDEIDQAGQFDSRMKSLYGKLKSVPDAVSDKDADELDDICDAVKELYNVYTDFYALATDPSGSYNSYSEDNSDTTDEYLECYRALKNLLD